jgi:hypothetical protein
MQREEWTMANSAGERETRGILGDYIIVHQKLHICNVGQMP